MTRSIALLGSTGSIGRQTLEVARELGLSVAALTANRSVDLIEQQAREFSPRLAVLYDEDAARELRARLSDTKIQVLSGMEGLLAAATAEDADTVVTAVMGMIGLQPTLAAIEKKKRIALANKETLVCAGELVVDAAEKYGAEIVPVDSEHSAIFQCLQGCRDRGEIKRLILTCSGGPFYGLSARELATKTKADALKHPNWTMGAKITIDSATLMNKGLEIIEAMRLYRLPLSQVDAVLTCIVLEFFVQKFSFEEIKPFFRTAFEAKLMLNTIAVMVFGNLLRATGVVDLLPVYLSKLPIPSFLVWTLIFAIGTLVGGSTTIYVLAIPMLITAFPGSQFYPMFLLVMSASYTVMQVNPTHICLTLCAEDFKIPLGSLIAKSVPLVIVATALCFGYYFILTAFVF